MMIVMMLNMFFLENMFFLFVVLLCFYKMKRIIDLISLLDLPLFPSKLWTVEWTFWWYWSNVIIKFQQILRSMNFLGFSFHQIKVKSWHNLCNVFFRKQLFLMNLFWYISKYYKRCKIILCVVNSDIFASTLNHS